MGCIYFLQFCMIIYYMHVIVVSYIKLTIITLLFHLDGYHCTYYFHISSSLIFLHDYELALHMEEYCFKNKVDKNIPSLQFMRYLYLQVKGKILKGQPIPGEHNYYVALRIIRSGGPGFQIKNDGELFQWVYVP